MTDRKHIAASVRQRHEAGEPINKLAREFKLPRSTAYQYAKGISVPGRTAGNELPDATVKAIKAGLAAGEKPLALASEHGCSESTVYHYKLGTRRKDVAA